MDAKGTKELAGVIIVLLIGSVSFALAMGWGKITGEGMDRDAVLFLAKIFGVMTLVGIILVFIL
jgi:hypothetical protein